MPYYRIKFKNGFETFMVCAPGFDVGGEILKWNDPELTLDAIDECDQLTEGDFQDIISQPEGDARQAKLAKKRPVKVDVKAEWQALQDEKQRGISGG